MRDKVMAVIHREEHVIKKVLVALLSWVYRVFMSESWDKP
jgi:hypothetical protein